MTDTAKLLIVVTAVLAVVFICALAACVNSNPAAL
jgi:hypothetical protein